jgi:hypothetical protein
MTTRSAPRRVWRSDGTEPLPSGAEALGELLAAFPSWFLRITCGRCGKDRMVSETHLQRGADMPIRDLLNRMRHDGCSGRAGEAELLTVAAILSLCVAASTCRAATPSGDQTPWRVSEQTDREYQTGIRECILGTGLKVGDDLLTIGFQALGSSVNLIVFRQSDSRHFRAGPSAVPVMLDDQSVLLVEGFATPTTFSGNLRYDGPWNRVFKDMQNSRTMTVHVGRDYTVSLNGFETAYKQWLVCVHHPRIN